MRYAVTVRSVLLNFGSDLVGVYVHGSAALGGFQPTSSDVDMLAVVAAAAPIERERALGDAIAATADRCPGIGLEMSVITAATAATIGECLFEVHVNTTRGRLIVVPGADHPGDPDLVLHAAVCRAHGLAVSGPPPARVFGEVARPRLLAAMTAELRWALHSADTAYAVLNACRALRFADRGVLCSKLDGGAWFLREHPAHPVVTAAVLAQRDGHRAAMTSQTRVFIEAICDQLSRAG
jgi:hypothetical protein